MLSPADLGPISGTGSAQGTTRQGDKRPSEAGGGTPSSTLLQEGHRLVVKTSPEVGGGLTFSPSASLHVPAAGRSVVASRGV